MAWKSKKYTKSTLVKRFSSSYINAGTQVDSKRVKILKEKKFKGLGNTVSYRDHVKSSGHVDNSLKVHYYQELPPTIGATLDNYKDIPNDKVPPIIVNLRKLKELKTRTSRDRKSFEDIYTWLHYTVIPGSKYHLVCSFSGAEAYFIEVDIRMDRIRMSIKYSTDYARLIASSDDPVKGIRWSESIPITVQ